MSNQLVSFIGAASPIVNIDSTALVLRDEAIALTGTIKSIQSDADVKLATAAAAKAKGLSKEIEASRLLQQKPLQKAIKEMNSQVKDYCEGLDNEVSRIESLLGAWMEKKRKEEEAAERERQRIACELEEANRRIAEAAEQKKRDDEAAEAVRLKAEQDLEDAQIAASEARDEAESLKAQAEVNAAQAASDKAAKDAEIARLKNEKEQLEKQNSLNAAAERASQFAAQQPATSSAKARGASVGGKKCYRITDLKALHAAHPFCAKLVEDKDQINYLLSIHKGGEIPGLEWWEETKVSVRSTPTAIEA